MVLSSEIIEIVARSSDILCICCIFWTKGRSLVQEGNCWAWRGGNVPCIPHPWIRPWINKELISKNDKILVTNILRSIRFLISSLCLREMFDEIKPCLKHNIIPALIVISGGVMCYMEAAALW